MFWKEALAYTMPEGYITVTEGDQQVRYDCKGAILDVGLYTPDPGMVPDGATCGDNKVSLMMLNSIDGSIDLRHLAVELMHAHAYVYI